MALLHVRETTKRDKTSLQALTSLTTSLSPLNKIGTFAGLHWENATLWINSTQSKFTQVDYPCRLWTSKVALCVTGAASHFVSEWLDKHPDQKENWEVFKAVFLERFTMKDSNMVIMTELRTFKMTGIIEDYIAEYEVLRDQSPNTINFDKTRPQLDHDWTSTVNSEPEQKNAGLSNPWSKF
ncbi:hypothetical protein DSO57_1006721 [Entomophthora muscae]|uniref:Uncharacterized protein n=1 Tax=Entomophthora muscae TaxID=34485 RepID=A0ACC2UST4_9FUNG|nr:hypothetical protein DSO57_1006721 [Entomophthora muscae]